jgi:hypothetical protein
VFLQRDPGILGSDPRTPPELLVDGKDPGNAGGLPLTPEGVMQRQSLEAFLLAFVSNLAPVVGQQVTLTAINAVEAGARIDLLISRAQLSECDLIAQTQRGGYVYHDGKFESVKRHGKAIKDAELRSMRAKHDGEVTYTCTPPRNGVRIAIGH